MKGLKILIVDDVATTRNLLKSAITQLVNSDLIPFKSIDFYFAGDGHQALTEFQNHKPNLVFLDIELPDQSGLNLLKQFKEQQANSHVIMVSGDATMDNVKKAIGSGAKGFIVKPFNVDKVKDAITGFAKTLK